MSRKKPDESRSVDSKEKARAKPGHKPLPLGSDARKNARVVFALAGVPFKRALKQYLPACLLKVADGEGWFPRHVETLGQAHGYS